MMLGRINILLCRPNWNRDTDDKNKGHRQIDRRREGRDQILRKVDGHENINVRVAIESSIATGEAEFGHLQLVLVAKTKIGHEPLPVAMREHRILQHEISRIRIELL